MTVLALFIRLKKHVKPQVSNLICTSLLLLCKDVSNLCPIHMNCRARSTGTQTGLSSSPFTIISGNVRPNSSVLSIPNLSRWHQMSYLLWFVIIGFDLTQLCIHAILWIPFWMVWCWKPLIQFHFPSCEVFLHITSSVLLFLIKGTTSIEWMGETNSMVSLHGWPDYDIETVKKAWLLNKYLHIDELNIDS